MAKKILVCTVLTVHSSYGDLSIDANTGEVLTLVPDGDPENLGEIACFDLDEWRKFYGREDLDEEFDILDLGYWLKGGTYEPPEPTWRNK